MTTKLETTRPKNINNVPKQFHKLILYSIGSTPADCILFQFPSYYFSNYITQFHTVINSDYLHI